jgi:hypothetical protein
MGVRVYHWRLHGGRSSPNPVLTGIHSLLHSSPVEETEMFNPNQSIICASIGNNGGDGGSMCAAGLVGAPEILVMQVSVMLTGKCGF